MYKKMAVYVSLICIVFSVGEIECGGRTKRKIKEDKLKVHAVYACIQCNYKVKSPGFFHAHLVAFHQVDDFHLDEFFPLGAEEYLEKIKPLIEKHHKKSKQ